jgi:hypothetical protein
MNEPNIDHIIGTFLQFDAAPPSPDYSHYDHAVSIAQRLDAATAASLVVGSIRRLPSTIVATIVDAVIDTVSIPQLGSILFREIAMAHEVSSASTIINIILKHSQEGHKDLANAVISELENAKTPDAQNRLAYALWVIPGPVNETSDTSVSAGPSKSHLIHMIERLLSVDSLTEYARYILTRCKDRWEE